MVAHGKKRGRAPSSQPEPARTLEPLRDGPPQKKRRRQETPPSRDGSPDDEASPNNITTGQRFHDHDTASRSLACPFYKSDPARYHQCARLNLSKMSYVKQHLARKHAPCSFCFRCYKTFDAEQDLVDHQLQHPPCEVKARRPLPWMSWEQMTKLKGRSNPAMNEVGQWEEIWNLLFPGTPAPASPYVELNIPQEVNEFREYLAQWIPPRIVNKFGLDDKTAPTGSREDISKEVMDIIMEVADQWIERRRGIEV